MPAAWKTGKGHESIEETVSEFTDNDYCYKNENDKVQQFCKCCLPDYTLSDKTKYMLKNKICTMLLQHHPLKVLTQVFKHFVQQPSYINSVKLSFVKQLVHATIVCCYSIIL
uniref:Uncharacterized protein n=1 Tax=Romanomermis culicivorax TaxID=13658 RepID=A0A915JWM0_ROMCU